MAPRLRRARGLVRFIASVAMTSGVLLLVDVGITVLWQEPISAFIANRAQARLERELGSASKLVARDKRAVSRRGNSRRRLAALAGRQARRIRTGKAIGRIELTTLNRSYVMVEGADAASVRKGPGHYEDTPLPGQRGTAAVAGHRTTYLAPFRNIDRLRPGDRIVASMPYGRFTYRVEHTKIVAPDAVWVKKRVRYDRLILTACHPLYTASQRIVVSARLVRAVLA